MAFVGKYYIASSFTIDDQGQVFLRNLAKKSWGYDLAALRIKPNCSSTRPRI